MTLVLLGKGLLLNGSTTKIQDKQVPSIYNYWTPSPPVRPPFCWVGGITLLKANPPARWKMVGFRVQRRSFPFGAFRPIFRWNPGKQPLLNWKPRKNSHSCHTSCLKKIVHYFGTFQSGCHFFKKKKGIRGIFSSVWKLEPCKASKLEGRTVCFPWIVLMEEILHHLGWSKHVKTL